MIEFWNQPRTFYPSMFRILIGLVLLLDLIFTFPSGSILFNPEFTDYPPVSGVIAFLRENYVPFYLAYGIILTLFILGIGKNFISLLLYVFQFLLFFMNPYLNSWGDVILKFILMYFVFVDSFRFLSFRKSNLSENSVWNYVSKLAVWSIVLHIFLIYLSNGIYKSMDTDWQNGYAAFYSFSQFSGFQDSFFYLVLSNENFSKILSWLVVAQQLTFVPLILWKKTRYFAIVLGILVHLIMFYQFGLWKFETIMILLYGFLLNDKEWQKIIPAKLRKEFV